MQSYCMYSYDSPVLLGAGMWTTCGNSGGFQERSGVLDELSSALCTWCSTSLPLPNVCSALTRDLALQYDILWENVRENYTQCLVPMLAVEENL